MPQILFDVLVTSIVIRVVVLKNFKKCFEGIVKNENWMSAFSKLKTEKKSNLNIEKTYFSKSR